MHVRRQRAVLAVLAVIMSLPAAAQQRVDQGAAAGRVIPNQYVVVLTPQEASAAADLAAAVAEAHGAHVLHVYRYALQGMAVQMTAPGAAAMAADPRVESVTPDEEAFLAATQPDATWGLDRIDQRDLPLNTTYVYDYTGAGVHAYVIDSGIRATHAEFIGRVGDGADFVNDGQGTNDCNGHGTHVSGTIGGTVSGVAKQVTLYPVRVFACGDTTPISTIIAGVDWVTANHVKPAVANMSVGDSAFSPLDTAVQNSIIAGVTYVVAAGNRHLDACTFSPARVGGAIVVGSSDGADARSPFSNWGTCLDLFAPGSAITSAGIATDTATAILSGTSMASAHVAGVAALYLNQFGNQTLGTVAGAIWNSATRNHLTDLLGSPNLLLYSLFAGGFSCQARTYPVSPSPYPGETATLFGGVTSTGVLPAAADTLVWFYVAGPAYVNWVGYWPAGGLVPGNWVQWFPFSWLLPEVLPPGNYEYLVEVWEGGTPKCRSGVQPFVVRPRPVRILSLSPVAGARPGAPAVLSAHVLNESLSPLPADARVWFYVSCNGANPWVASASVAGLAPGASAWYAGIWNIPANHRGGSCTYWAIVYGYGVWSSGKPFHIAVPQRWDFVGTMAGWTPVHGTWVIDAQQYLLGAGLTNEWASIQQDGVHGNVEYSAWLWRNGADTSANTLLIRGTPDPLNVGLWNSAYYFQYTRSGDFSVFKVVDGVTTVLQNWTPSSAIVQGSAWNALRVAAFNNTLWYWINGTLVWTGSDASLPGSRRIGITFHSPTPAGNLLWTDWATLIPLDSEPTEQMSEEQRRLNDAAGATATGGVHGTDG